ncbi:hypothetical protein GGR51DRAFT_200467 [Nemania sp. FL0031]|nr:hypothetical protein GGR51DRAFT_200467 [Nemania sp. FL0031]
MNYSTILLTDIRKCHRILLQWANQTSLSTRHNDFIGFVAKDLFTTVQDYDKQTLENIAKLLPDLLKEFVLSLGSGGEDALHRTLLSLVRTHYKAILSSFEALLLGKGILLAAKKNINDEITNYYADSMTSSTPLPRRGDDDAQAVATNCDNDEGDADENNYRHFLMNTPAYQWLISEIGKEGRLLRADHDIMEDVKAIVLQCLPSPSDGAPLQRHKGTFELQWDPLLFFKEQRFKGNLTDVFGGAITITGSGSDAQALTVRDYLSQTWPTTCESILQLVANTIHNTTNYAASIELLDGTCVESVIYNGSFIVDVMGTRQSLVDIAQQIVWLGAALRSSDFEDGVASCTPIILNELKASTISTTPEIRALPPRDIFFKVQFAMVKLVDETIPGKCWHRMFKNPVMVNGYPILARNERELGLEIPLGIMGALVASKQVEVFEGMLFIKGFSAMLVSTKVISNNLNHHTVIWHYIFNPEGKKISYLEHNIGKDHDFTLEDLKNARHIVGWCANTTYHAGSGDARYDITESGLPPPHSGCILERVTISVGKGITGGGSFALGIKDVPIHVNSDGYIPSISSMSENYVVLWDENEKRGWLVNAASALLHIVMTALRYYSTTTLARQLLFKMEEMINPKDFNAESALEILTDATNRQLKIFLDRCESFEESVDQMEPEARRKVNFYLFEDLVEDRCRMLDQIMAHHENLAGRNGINLKPRVRKHLEGWDFADLAKGRKVYPHVATLNALGYGWVDFVRTIGAIPLFGRGFGDIIRPANPDIMCPNWASLPMEKYYLATTLFDMENIMARFGNRWSNPKKAVHGLDLYCPGQTLALRQCCALQGIRHHDPVHVFYPERYSRVLGSQSTEWSNLDSTSALVFGHNLVWRYRWRDKGEEELEECKPSPEFSCCQLGGSLNPVTVLASRNTALSIQAELATVPPSRLFTSSSITTKQRPNPDRAQEQNPHVISNADSARSRRQEMRISQGVGRS